LHDRGFTDLTLIEKSGRIGGKSKTFEIDGEGHEVGTCYVTGKYECIELWADAMNMTEVPIDKERLISSDAAVLMDMKAPAFGKVSIWAADYAFRKYGVNPVDFASTLESDVMKYIEAWRATMGQTEYVFPDESRVDFKQLNQTFLSWLHDKNLTALISRLSFSTAAQGYGGLADMPALYGLMWNHPNLLTGGQHSMLLDGFQTLWERLLATTNAKVHLNAECKPHQSQAGCCRDLHRWCPRDIRMAHNGRTDA
jgi:phytoene dehydrogenase-like protein